MPITVCYTDTKLYIVGLKSLSQQVSSTDRQLLKQALNTHYGEHALCDLSVKKEIFESQECFCFQPSYHRKNNSVFSFISQFRLSIFDLEINLENETVYNLLISPSLSKIQPSISSPLSTQDDLKALLHQVKSTLLGHARIDRIQCSKEANGKLTFTLTSFNQPNPIDIRKVLIDSELLEGDEYIQANIKTTKLTNSFQSVLSELIEYYDQSVSSPFATKDDIKILFHQVKDTVLGKAKISCIQCSKDRNGKLNFTLTSLKKASTTDIRKVLITSELLDGYNYLQEDIKATKLTNSFQHLLGQLIEYYDRYK